MLVWNVLYDEITHFLYRRETDFQSSFDKQTYNCLILMKILCLIYKIYEFSDVKWDISR